MDPVTLDARAAENGLAMMLQGLLAENLAASASKRRDFDSISSTFGIVAPDAEVTVTLEFEGREPVSKKAGEALLEPINVKVRAANHGQTPTRVVIFQVSPPSAPFLTPLQPIRCAEIA